MVSIPELVRNHCLAVLVILVLAVPAIAQENTGLPFPSSRDTLEDYPRQTTRCERCLEQERVYHQQIEFYEAARAEYYAYVSEIQPATDSFLTAHAEQQTRDAAVDKAAAAIDAHFATPAESRTTLLSALQSALEKAKQEQDFAKAATAEARRELDDRLRNLERLRQTALEAMRRTSQAYTRMLQCEFACDLSELNFEDPVIETSPPTVEPEDVEIPQPEEITPVTATCLECQPLADQANEVLARIQRIAEEAQDIAQSLRTSGRFLAEAEQTKAALEQEQRELYRELPDSFPVTLGAPGEFDPTAEDIIDRRNQREAARRLTDLNDRLARVEGIITGLNERLDELRQQLDEALENYRIANVELEVVIDSLADCERRCETSQSTENSDGVLQGKEPDAENGQFVTTDCERCEDIADLLNDVMGAIERTVSNLDAEQSELDRITAEIAAKQAAKNAAQAALAQAASEKAQREETGQDTSAAQEALDRNLERAAQLLSEIRALEPRATELAGEVERLSGQLAELTEQRDALNTLLEECEAPCTEDQGSDDQNFEERNSEDETSFSSEPVTPRTGSIPQFVLNKEQDNTCRSGQSCAFTITVSNKSDGPYTGPIFVTESQRGSAGEDSTDWFCSRAAQGETVCIYDAEALAPGAELSLGFNVQLPNQVNADAQNCVSFPMADDERMIAQLVQAGLNARGYDAGVADGIPGPRTNRAAAAFTEDFEGAVDARDLTALYEAIYGAPAVMPENASRTCVVMDVEQPVFQRPQTQTPNSSEPPAEDEEQDQPLVVEQPRMQINFEDRVVPRGENVEQPNQQNRGPGISIGLPGLGGGGGISF